MSLWTGLTSLSGVSKAFKLKSGSDQPKSLLGPRNKQANELNTENGDDGDQEGLDDIVTKVVVEEVKEEPIRIRDLRRDVDMDSGNESGESEEQFLSIR